ncbi:MAG: leucine-rich repeat protein [Bacteroidaceae bacterium]|nr:leucine-rich repeat protein [Bacteroidaceae bacterium]
MKKQLLILFAALLPMLASAQTKVEINGIYYNLYAADTYEAEVTRSDGTSYSGSITIPATVTYNGVAYSVTSIGEWAFGYCSSLTSITLPASVTSIGTYAFFSCSSLESFICRALTPPTVSPNTFYGVDKSILIYVHASYMPDYQSAEWWGEFSNYQYINADAAGDELFTLSDWSSYNQWQANSSSSETYTFSVYSESVLFFDWQVSSEEGYDKLIVTLDGVKILNESGEKSGHYKCLVSSGDHALVVEYTKDYGGNAGNDCATITNIVLAKPAIASGTCGNELMWRITDSGRLIISGLGDMFDFENRERVPWYNHLKDILSVTIEEGLTSIGELAFADCSLTAITIPEGVTSIGAYAFVGCSNLERVQIPTSMASIAETAFNGCRKLRHILIDRKNSVYFSGESNTCIIELSTKTLLVGTIYGTIPNGIEHLGNFAFSGRNVEDIIIPNGVISLGEYTFCGECSIRSITIPPSLKHVGNWTFDEGSLINKGCPNLSAVYIEDLKAWLELDFPYHYCAPLYYAHNLYLNGERLEVITIPEGVITLKRNAFAGWNGSEVIFPESLTEISSGAFNSCENLAAITCHAMNPPICNSAFFDVDKSIPVYIPKESFDAYRSAEGWREFINFRPIMKPVTVITLNLTSATLTEEESLTLTATVSPDDADDKTIIWNSSNASVATVDNMGKVTAIAPGTATITATANDGSDVNASCEVSVVAAQYTITYYVDGKEYHRDILTRGSTISPIKEPVKEGYTFSGWSEVPETMPAHDVTVNATFTVNKYIVTFKVGDEVIAANTLEYGAAIVAPEAPEKEGHTFAGWGEVAATVPAKDITYEGSYTVNNYTVTFKIGEEVIYSERLPYGAEITIPEAPEKEGHTFAGWGEVAATVPAKDITYEGSYTVNNYTVTFKIGEEVIYSERLPYGAEITIPEAPEKEGHTFAGWGEVAATVPAGDVTYEGTYTVITYNVYYYVGDELVHTIEVAYGDAIPEYNYEPTIEGDVFMGWIGETYDAMPAHDVTYTANIVSSIENSEISIQNSAVIYDLTGRKVSNMENLKGGIYIINGRKVVIK